MLKRKHRLAKESEVKQTFAKGRSFFSPYFLLKVLKKPQQTAKFTVVVSTKVSKKAVVRNRVKRLVREVLRLNIGKFASGSYVISVKPSVGSLELEDGKKLQKLFLDFLSKIKVI